jgi:hypothetical protein
MSLSLPVRRILAALALVGGGVLLRACGPAQKIPALYIAYGGVAIWAAALYFLLALLLPSRPQKQLLIVAAVVCGLVELSKLVHTPALDILRLTQFGGALLGRHFNSWNFAACAVGLMVALALDRMLLGFAPRKPQKKSRSRRR